MGAQKCWLGLEAKNRFTSTKRNGRLNQPNSVKNRHTFDKGSITPAVLTVDIFPYDTTGCFTTHPRPIRTTYTGTKILFVNFNPQKTTGTEIQIISAEHTAACPPARAHARPPCFQKTTKLFVPLFSVFTKKKTKSHYSQQHKSDPMSTTPDF